MGSGVVAMADPELLDQEKRTKPVHTQERMGPHLLRSHARVSGQRGGEYSGKGMMEVRSGDGVPGVAGQGACEKTALVINEMVDYISTIS